MVTYAQHKHSLTCWRSLCVRRQLLVLLPLLLLVLVAESERECVLRERSECCQTYDSGRREQEAGRMGG